MTKIYELLKNEDTIYAFDVDGCLAKMEYGEYNHYDEDDDAWAKACDEGVNLYTEDLVIKKMQKFVKSKNPNNIYVITKVFNDKEAEFKVNFLSKNYNIKQENIYYVLSNEEKVEVLKQIKEKHPNLDEHKLVMVDDTVDVLTSIMDKTNFTTIHISSFLDL